MSEHDGGQPVVVDVGACRCPGGPHANDWVALAPVASFEVGMAASAAITVAGGDPMRLEVEFAKAFVAYGVIAWNLTTRTVEDGRPGREEPLRLDPATVLAKIPWNRGGREVAEKAIELYRDDVITPLVERMLKRSQPSSTDDSTSASPPSQPSALAPSAPSSTATSAGKNKSAA